MIFGLSFLGWSRKRRFPTIIVRLTKMHDKVDNISDKYYLV